MSTVPIPSAAKLLGYAGLVPFFGLALTKAFGPEVWADQAGPLLVGYGAVILSFMGGCQWGFAAAGLGDGPTVARLGTSVAPALYAWIVAALLPVDQACLALMVGIVMIMSLDLRLARENGTPPWWLALRFPLTAGAAIALALGAFV